jgi:hypothetical protein
MTNCKRCEWKRSWPNLRYYPDICLEGLRKATKTFRISDLRAEV